MLPLLLLDRKPCFFDRAGLDRKRVLLNFRSVAFARLDSMRPDDGISGGGGDLRRGQRGSSGQLRWSRAALMLQRQFVILSDVCDDPLWPTTVDTAVMHLHIALD